MTFCPFKDDKTFNLSFHCVRPCFCFCAQLWQLMRWINMWKHRSPLHGYPFWWHVWWVNKCYKKHICHIIFQQKTKKKSINHMNDRRNKSISCSVVVCGAGSGVCELTNRSRLDKETGAKTKHFRQSCSTGQSEKTHVFCKCKPILVWTPKKVMNLKMSTMSPSGEEVLKIHNFPQHGFATSPETHRGICLEINLCAGWSWWQCISWLHAMYCS